MVNKVILIGRLGADPEVKQSNDGTPITSFRMATEETWKTKDGERVSRTEWHRVVAFKRLAEVCANYLTKGKLVYVEGRVQTRTWEDRDGIKRYSTEIIATEMNMLDKKEKEPESTQTNDEEDVPF